MKVFVIALSILMGIITVNPSKTDFNYEKAWKEVEELINSGLPKSALEKTEEIYKIAESEKNDAQLTKSIIYISRLTIVTDEKGMENAIARLEGMVNKSHAPVKQISASYLAELYQKYFDNYRWEISQRTELSGEKGPDFRTWTTQQFLQTIETWYLFSVNDHSLLKSGVDDFLPVMNPFDKAAKPFRPTLYEVLADRAFDFFNSYDTYSNENAASFAVNEPWYLADAKEFIGKKVVTDDTASSRYKMIRLYQDILRIQINAGNKEAAADYDLKRMQYVFQQATMQDKAELYINGLTRLADVNKNAPYYTEIIAAMANQIKSQKEDTLANVKALNLCKDAVKKHPESPGAGKCLQIINEITKPSLQLYGELVYPSGAPLLLAMDYNNVNSIKIETVKLDQDFYKLSRNDGQEKVIDYLKKATKLRVEKKNLTKSENYVSQRMEMSHTKLPYGEYAVLVSSLDVDKPILQYIIFHISDLAYTSFIADGKRNFIVNNRVTGQPVAGVKITLLQQNYNPSNRKYEFIKSGNYITDAQGRVAVTNQLAERNFKVVLDNGKDHLDLNQFHYDYQNYEANETKFGEFYTDRSIYRPGQVVFFKTILIKNSAQQIPALLKNETVDVVFKDANYQEISRLSLTSSPFGSIQGSFTIPTGRMNGSFTLELQSKNDIYGMRNIQVEEYKRPTFEVKAEPVKGEYKLNEKIKMQGVATTLAGTAVDGAQVKYKVIRTARFPGWGWWWRMPYPSSEFIVMQGESTTDADGKFIVEFTAIPDLKVDKKDQPVFVYRVDADVTDQRGETRSFSESVSAGYTAYTLSSNVSNTIDKVDIKPLKILAKSHSNQEVVVSGTYVLSQLKEPTTVLINRYWDGKTNFPLPKEMAEKYFPQYPVSPENDFSKWEIARKVISGSFTTNDSTEIKSKLAPAVYKLEAQSTDMNGEKVILVNYFVVTDFEKNMFPKSDFLFTKLNKTSFEPGEKIEIQAGASEKPVFVHALIEKDGQLLYDKIIKADKKGLIQLPVSDSYRGGVNVKINYIIQNRRFEKSYHLDVPWTNKDLKITFETFRDKTLPGAKEEYRIKISGQQKDKIAAEMVAAMYDASLDQFISHNWRSSFYPSSYASVNIEVPGFNLVTGQYYYYGNEDQVAITNLNYPSLIPLTEGSVYYNGGRGNVVMMKSMRAGAPQDVALMDGVAPSATAQESQTNPSDQAATTTKDEEGKSGKAKYDEPLRKNLKETVFFFPEVRTDKDGDIILAFNMNEALTRWRLMSFVHTQDFMTGYDDRTVQTQKNIMVFPNAPRFVRDGDVISFSAKVSNLSEQALKGKASLQILDAITMKDITYELVKSPAILDFSLEKGRSQGLTWDLFIPDAAYQAITYRITAEANGHTDGEENTIPVITNRMLVTESMPLWIKGNETKTFTFNAFKNNVSTTKKDFRYTFEYTSNPVWYAIQALPYINSQSNPGTLAISERLFANALASKIAIAHPKIKAVFDQWNSRDKDALISNLSKNQELKTALLEETPWLMQAVSETEQKRNIAILFDLNKMADEKANAIQRLAERQISNGGFPWISGGREDVYTTQNILENIGHLYHLGVLEIKDSALENIISKALNYMDTELVRRYQKLQEDIKRYGGNINDDHLDDLSVHYMYVRTFFKHTNPLPLTSEARKYYYGQAQKYWTKRDLYTQAMIGLVLHRNDDNMALNVTKSLREKSFSNEELGMYWNQGNGFYWYQLPIERHALMIELFAEVESKKDEADKMKIWLLKNKQTNHWKTSKSTAAAIYALLIQGEKGDISQWVTESIEPDISIGKENIIINAQNSEAGTGYIKKIYTGDMMSKDMAIIRISNKNKSIAWGASYYQYFEQLDKIKTFEDTPLKLNKKLYKVARTARGEILEEIVSGTILKPGDKLIVRIELRVDRQMEYVHMKDMRASGFEPINVISEHKQQGQLGYYETTRDVATHFYFNYLPKGTFVFEYPLTAVHRGEFSGGITSIECMYAPEFSSHSNGVSVKVK